MRSANSPLTRRTIGSIVPATAAYLRIAMYMSFSSS
jgi:hypothetical protein